MIKLFGPPIPNDIYVACSGGVDSMAALSFLAKKPYRTVTVAVFNHGTETGDEVSLWLPEILANRFPNVKLIEGSIGKANKGRRQSQEEFWRIERYKFFHALDKPVVMAHHLDDCIESWFFTAMNGDPHTIPYQNQNVVRPFLTTPKDELVNWCIKNEVPWCTDKSNNDLKFVRNRIRHKIIPEVFKVNPGIRKVIAKQVEKEYLVRAVSSTG